MRVDKYRTKARLRTKYHIPEVKTGKDPAWATIIVLVLLQLWPIAAFLFCKRLWNGWQRKKNEDYRACANMIGSRCEVSINELSAKLGKTPSLVMSDLQTMISKGYLGPDAYIDRARGMLVLQTIEADFVEMEEEVEDEEPEQEMIHPEVIVLKPVKKEEKAERPAVQPKHAQKEEPAAAPTAEPEQKEDDFEEKLRRIRRLNDEIDDEEVSARIDRIGELTASIFAVVRENPERADEVRKFMNYYLPTTLKLLKSYALMEKQSYQGSNIVASRKKIEDILDTLITAFEQQQDRLFRTEAMDVQADIEVLETMMAKDGLVTPKGTDLRSVMGGR